MNALTMGKKYWDLIDPHTGDVVRTVEVKELWRKITTSAHRNGEPGVLFIDVANDKNPVPKLYELEATNPCGEQWLGPYENCCLGSINLSEHHDGEGVDWDKLQETVYGSTLFLDSVITANKYIPAVPSIEVSAYTTRRIGLGFMGLADLMFKMGIRYGSEESFTLAANITEFIRFHAMYMSCVMSSFMGPFPAFKDSIYRDGRFAHPWTMHSESDKFDCPNLDWDLLSEMIANHGLRNATTLTVAPTGTLATVASLEGYGCEPAFALSYIRTVKTKDGDMELSYLSPLLEKALADHDLSEDQINHVFSHVKFRGNLNSLMMLDLPDEIRNTFVVSADISPDQHVGMQSVIQAYVDNSLSKTCNLPRDAMVVDVDLAYREAWKRGCKGITVYVAGSRDEAVLETGRDRVLCYFY